MDCSQPIGMVGAVGHARSLHTHLAPEIQVLANQVRHCSFLKVYRGQARVSHVLAYFARAKRRTAIWPGSCLDVSL
jgi:hypothetical protein